MAFIGTTDYYLNVARGLVSGVSLVNKFGAGTVSTTETDIAAISPIIWPTTAETVRIKAGGNANDASAGTGARQITVVGLDNNWAEATETITTNGASVSSATTTQFYRVYRAYVSQTGTYHGTNAGDITIENSSSVQALIRILAGYGQTQTSAYTVPAGKTAYLINLSFHVDTTKNAEVRMYQHPNADDFTSPYTGAKRIVHRAVGVSGSVDDKMECAVTFAAKTDIWFAGLVAASTADISVDYRFYLVTN